MIYQNTEALKNALISAAGNSIHSPVLSTEAYIKMQCCFWANLSALLNAWRTETGAGIQIYGLASEYAKRVGRSLNTVKDWLRQLEAMGMIHPIEGAPSRPGAVGDTLCVQSASSAWIRKHLKYIRSNPCKKQEGWLFNMLRYKADKKVDGVRYLY